MHHDDKLTVALSTRGAARRGRPFTVGFVAGGLGTYWPQFPGLFDQLRANATIVREQLAATGAHVFDAGFVSNEVEAASAGEQLRAAGCDLLVCFVATYLTSSMVVPIAQRARCPVLLANLQPSASMDHARFSTGDWLAYCGACSLPELANAFARCGIELRSVSGFLGDPRAWARIGCWLQAAMVRAALASGRHGLMGHLYPGMYDVAVDPTIVPAYFGGHVEVLEFDDLRVRVAEAAPGLVAEKIDEARERFDVDATVDAADLAWAAKVAVGLEQLVNDFDLDTLAYYHRGLDGEVHERLGAGMILGASLVTAGGAPACGEFELRTSLAMMIMEHLGAGGTFTELQALNFTDNVVEMGHDGPAHLGMSDGRPLLRGLGVFHGKRGWGVSVELSVRRGPVTLLGIAGRRDGRLQLVLSEGEVVGGPLLRIGNTTSRVAFLEPGNDAGHPPGIVRFAEAMSAFDPKETVLPSAAIKVMADGADHLATGGQQGGRERLRDPGAWCDAWAASGIGHHWALGLGHQGAVVAALADLLGMELVRI